MNPRLAEEMQRLSRDVRRRFRNGTASAAEIEVWHEAEEFADTVFCDAEKETSRDALRYAFICGAYFEQVRRTVGEFERIRRDVVELKRK